MFLQPKCSKKIIGGAQMPTKANAACLATLLHSEQISKFIRKLRKRKQ
jgi:hypothetical protein